jgi:hypothetical protein
MSSRQVWLLAAVALVGVVGSAAALLAADAPADVLRGKVVSVDTDKGTLVVAPRNGDNVTVATDKDTKVTVDGKDATLADVKAGLFVEVSPATGTAKTITARAPQAEGLRGKVVSVDTDKGTLVVAPHHGDNVTVTTDKDTKIAVDGKDATLADVKADMFVMVSPASGTAKTINAHTPKAK